MYKSELGRPPAIRRGYPRAGLGSPFWARAPCRSAKRGCSLQQPVRWLRRWQSMPDNDDYGFFVQLYEDVEGVATYTGIIFESGVLGEEVPRAGDCIISPLRKANFDPIHPGNHFAFDIQRRYFLPDVTREQASIIKLLPKRRELTEHERQLRKVR